MKILIINGPNLNMLGIREPSIYGTMDYKGLCKYIEEEAKKRDISVDFFQSNSEGEIIDEIQQTLNKYDGLVINPGAYTHYSYAIHDAIKSVENHVPTVEIHISDIKNREPWREISVTAPACIKQISGHGICGYVEAIDFLLETKN